MTKISITCSLDVVEWYDIIFLLFFEDVHHSDVHLI